MSGSNAGYAGSGPSHGKRSPVPNTSAAGIDLRTTTRRWGGKREVKDEDFVQPWWPVWWVGAAEG